MKLNRLHLAGLLLLSFGCAEGEESPNVSSGVASAPAPAESAEIAETLAEFLVYKTPTCGCCNGWVDHLREHGHEVETRDMANLVAIKQDVGVPVQLASCHTAMLDGYVIEGHVPNEAIQWLLADRPEIAGLAVPGMPIGSPGMEGPNAQPYMVYAFDRDGNATEFMEIDPR